MAAFEALGDISCSGLTILDVPAEVRQLYFTGISHAPQSQERTEPRVDSKKIREELKDLERRLLKLEPTQLAGSNEKFREETEGFAPIETKTRQIGT